MADQNSTQSETPTEKPSKLDALLGGLIAQTEGCITQASELALPNDPDGDQIMQTALRTQALSKIVINLAKTVISLTKATRSGFGATGTVLSAIGQDVESMKAFIGPNAPATAAAEAPQEMIEVDDTGAPEAPPAAPPPPAVATPKAPKKAKPVAAAPVGPPVSPPAAPPIAGMPAEVANLPQSTPAAIASVAVK